MEYDANAVRTALTRLRDLQTRMEGERSSVAGLPDVRPPGDAPTTAEFHRGYLAWAGHLQGEHQAAGTDVQRAIDTLIAIDREYNNGELAVELGFQQATGNHE